MCVRRCQTVRRSVLGLDEVTQERAFLGKVLTTFDVDSIVEIAG
jgi:hypothetical protein